jgi:AraC-like DNA-binding protein
MVKKRREFINHKYLYKNMFFIILISLLPVAVIGVVSNYRMTETMNSELMQANTRILALTMNTVESIIYQVKDGCRIIKGEKIFSDFQNIEKGAFWYEAKKEFYNRDELVSMYNYLSLKKKIFERLESETITNTFVDSVYFIDYINNAVLTSKRELFDFNGFYDKDLFNHLNRQLSFWGMIERQAVDARGLENQVLTIYYGAGFNGDNQIFVMNLHSGGFYEYLRNNIFKGSRDTFLMIRDGKLVLEPAEGRRLLNENVLEKLKHADRMEPPSWKIGGKDGSHFVTALFSEQLYWWFLSLTSTSELLRTSNYIRQMLIAVSLILMVFAAGSAIIWSFTWYKPIKAITANIFNHIDKQALPKIFPKNELKFIDYGIREIFSERDSLQERIAEMLPSYKEKYILNLLKGISLDKAGSSADKENYVAPLLREQLAVIVLKIGKTEDVNTGSPEGNAAFLVYVTEIVNSMASPLTGHFYTLLDEYERIILIINIENERKPELFELCGRINEKLAGLIKRQCFCGISRIHKSLDELSEAFEEAQEALSYSVFFPDSPVTYVEDIQIYPQPGRRKIFELPLSFFTALGAGKDEEAIKLLMEYFQTVGIRDDSGRGIRINDIFMYLLSKLYDLMEELNINDEDMLKRLSAVNNNLLQRNEIAALEGVKGLISGIAAVYRRGLIIKNNNRVSKAREILDRDYCSVNISLSSVADEVGLNPDYLGRIFREDTGMSFVDFLTNLRIQKSVTLLKATNMQIKEISFEVGYNNPNYFIKVFKEHLGVTPKEYKSNLQ